MNKFIIITARTKSSRLKNKILQNVNSSFKSIDILVSRASRIGPEIILATSNDKSDDDLANYVKNKYFIRVFRGNLNNKVKRWHQCYLKYKIDYACMIDGDDLAFDFDLYKKEISSKNLSKYDIIKYCKGIVTGSFTYIFSKKFIKSLANQTKIYKNLDVIDFFINKKKFKIKTIYIQKKLKNHRIRLTLDYKKDLLFFRELYKHKPIFEKTNNIIKYLLKNKKISNINYALEVQWKKNQNKEITKHATK